MKKLIDSDRSGSLIGHLYPIFYAMIAKSRSGIYGGHAINMVLTLAIFNAFDIEENNR